jgi:hypothetical protein
VIPFRNFLRPRLECALSFKLILTAMLSHSPQKASFAALVLLAHMALPGASPQVVIDRSSHDFGEIFCGESRACAFTVRNTGDAPLQLVEGERTDRSAPVSQIGSHHIRLAAFPGAALAPG